MHLYVDHKWTSLKCTCTSPPPVRYSRKASMSTRSTDRCFSLGTRTQEHHNRNLARMVRVFNLQFFLYIL